MADEFQATWRTPRYQFRSAPRHFEEEKGDEPGRIEFEGSRRVLGRLRGE